MATPSTSPFPFNIEPTLWPRAMDARAAVEIGNPLLVDRLTNITLQVSGTFTATIDAEGSHDGVTFVAVASGLAPGMVEISERFKFIRLNTTAFTSGTPIVFIDGDDQGER